MLDVLSRVEVGGRGPRLAAPPRSGVGLERLGGAGRRCTLDVHEGGVCGRPRLENVGYPCIARSRAGLSYVRTVGFCARFFFFLIK